MNDKLVTLAERRQKLIDKAASQRVALAQSMVPLRRPLMIAEHGLQVARYLRQHPFLMVAAAGVSAALMHKLHLPRLSALLPTGWSAFQLVRRVAQLLLKR